MNEEKGKNKNEFIGKLKDNVWKSTTIVLFIILVMMLATINPSGFVVFGGGNADTVAQETVNFINANLIQEEGIQAELVNSKEENGLITVTIVIAGETMDLFVTKNGNQLFFEPIDMTQEMPTYDAPQETTSAEPVNVDLEDNPEKLNVYFFWGEGCPYCDHQKPYLEEWEERYPEVEIKMFETWKTPENVPILQAVASAYDTQVSGVPATFIGDEYWVGFTDSMAVEMESYIESLLDEGIWTNPADKLQ